MNKKFRKLVSELGLSVRAVYCLTKSNLLTVGDLVEISEIELTRMRRPFIGRKTIDEVKAVLKGMGLSLQPSPIKPEVEADMKTLEKLSGHYHETYCHERLGSRLVGDEYCRCAPARAAVNHALVLMRGKT